MKKFLSVVLALMLTFTLSLSAFAIESGGKSWPETIKDFDGEYHGIREFMDERGDKHGLIYYNVDTGLAQLFLTDAELYVDGNGNVQASSGGSIGIFNYSADCWVQAGGGSLGSPVVDKRYLAGTINPLYDGTGTLIYSAVNFPVPPLAELIQEVTDQALLEEMAKMSQTVRLLTVCGIGSMALLIGLALFGKRSLLFRS